MFGFFSKCFTCQPSTEQDIECELVSANVMHWIPAKITRQNAGTTEERALGLARQLADMTTCDVIIAQETFPSLIEQMKAQGYMALVADDSQGFFQDLFRGKRGFTGLAIFIRRSHLKVLGHAHFHRYNAQAYFTTSPSGTMRTDGFQWVTIQDTTNQNLRIICNTHLESFDDNIRQRQMAELVFKLRMMRLQHRNAIIQFGGDFNGPQGSFIHHFAQQLGAISVTPQEAVIPTFENERLDGIFTILPKHLELKNNFCSTVSSHGNSDHKFVFQRINIGPGDHSKR